MKVYAVGGCVRDQLLDLPVTDRDWVVVGATPDELIRQGYLPVGRDFPVFLHPATREEYALARTERKTAPGYHGFAFHAAPGVTLEEDLARRDLTINAMALGSDGAVIDPFGGRADLEARVLRHVGPAFSEDPVRILRVARFAARFADFTVAPETLTLMRGMTAAGEVDALVPERVWVELARGLMEQQPARMFDVLRSCGTLARLIPELDRLWGVPQRPEYHPEIDTGVHVMMVLTQCARLDFAAPVRFAALLHDLGKGTTDPALWPRHDGHEARSAELAEKVCARLRVPGDRRDLALIAAREHGESLKIGTMAPDEVLRLFERCDALRRPERFAQFLDVCEADYRGRLGHQDDVFALRDPWERALAAVRAVDAGAIARQHDTPLSIAVALRTARVATIRDTLA
jgi:tRNA nucleotidyltransferase (CCA-adding enzyme)